MEWKNRTNEEDRRECRETKSASLDPQGERTDSVQRICEVGEGRIKADLIDAITDSPRRGWNLIPMDRVDMNN